jgi:prevent-host-death family protein
MTHMVAVGVHEAKTRLSELLRRVAAGEEIVIMRGRDPVARLIPAAPLRPRRLGIDQGVFVVPDDFDAPLSDELLHRFER